MDRALSVATTPGQSGRGNKGNEEVLHIPQSPSITGPSPSDCLVSYPGHLLCVCVCGGSYSSAEMQLLYSTAPANWAILRVNVKTFLFQIIQFSISIQFRCHNSSILNNSV